MLAFPAMIRLYAALVLALFVASYTATYAQHIYARNLSVPENPAANVAPRNSAVRQMWAREVPAPYKPAHEVMAPYKPAHKIPAPSEPAHKILVPYKPAPEIPARTIRVQDLPPDLTREQVLSALGSRDSDIRRGAYVALGVLGKNEDLPLLFSALYDNDKLLRKIAEDAIWKVWGRSGNATHDRLFRVGVEEMQSGELSRALGSFTTLIQVAPDFAEAWNKRATLYFMLGENDLSIADCDEVLSREPNHFGALSGYGLLMLRQGNYRRALEYFEQALTANPNMPGVQRNIDMITERLQEQEGSGV
jgi:tetratricopeptide (TPR) repeat protein